LNLIDNTTQIVKIKLL